MPKAKLYQPAQRGVKALLLVQTGIMTGMSILCGILNGEKAFFSAISAGFCCIIPMIVFACMVFKKSGARAALSIARSFYRAEAVKWLLTAGLIVLVFAFIPIVGGSFFVTFCVMQLSYWVILGLLKY